MFLAVAKAITKGSSFLVEVHVGGRTKSDEVEDSCCCADLDCAALDRWVTLARDISLGRVWLTSEEVYARDSDMRFCITDRGCSAAFLFRDVRFLVVEEPAGLLRGCGPSYPWRGRCRRGQGNSGRDTSLDDHTCSSAGQRKELCPCPSCESICIHLNPVVDELLSYSSGTSKRKAC